MTTGMNNNLRFLKREDTTDDTRPPSSGPIIHYESDAVCPEGETHNYYPGHALFFILYLSPVPLSSPPATG